MLETRNTKSSPATETFRADFRLFLQSELRKRCEKNPHYSLRSFAKFLGLESSRLSKILRGQRPISAKLIPELAARLGLSARETQEFCHATRNRKHAPASNQTYRQLSLDAFESIEDWRHYAILELMKVATFKPEPKWVAKAIGVTVSEAHIYLERLERVGLLERRPDGSWHDRSEGFSSHILSANETTAAHRRSQKKILELAVQAVDHCPIEKREQSSMMMATSAAKIEEAKRMVQAFRRELCDFLESGNEKRDSVYQLSISLFPLIDKTGDSQ